MDYYESLAILDGFLEQYKEIFDDFGASYGAQVVPGNGDAPQFQVLVTSDDERQKWEQGVPASSFTYLYNNEDRSIPVQVVSNDSQFSKIPASVMLASALGDMVSDKAADAITAAAQPIAAGEAVAAYIPRDGGTVGFNLYLDGAPSLISCWHVLCNQNGATPTGSCTAGGECTPVAPRNLSIAYLSYYQGVAFNTLQWHTFDLAVATYNNVAMAGANMTSCADGRTPPYAYPTAMAGGAVAGNVYKVGAAWPYCQQGTFGGIVYSGRVTYDQAHSALFRGQLRLPRMTESGDSGSLVIYCQSNQILGLNFAINDNSSLANPLFTIPWKYQGVDGATRLPRYATH